jgi:hypothetical protein
MTRKICYAKCIKGIWEIHEIIIRRGKILKHRIHIQFGRKGRI